MRGCAFLAAGSFDEAYMLEWFDVDLAFRLREQGQAVLAVPTVTIPTLCDIPPPLSSTGDGTRLQQLHPAALDSPDPYLHPAVVAEQPFIFRN